METGGAVLASTLEGTNLPITGHKLNGQNYTTKATATENSPFSKEQMDMLQKLLQQNMKTENSSSSASLAQKGNYLNALSAYKGRTTDWILGSRASDHMTRDINAFNKYYPCHENCTVRIADGTHSKVVGKGSVVVSKDITLKDVLYVPKLDCNLLSISKLTKDLNCVTKFHPYLCEFQALDSGKKIGNAEECAGLYLLRLDDSKRNQEVSKSACAATLPKIESVMLWHYRLGHPNFMYLQKLFPSLFKQNPNIFHCDVCQLAKHTRNTYPSQPYKPSHPFSLIHSDVWGPSRINNITGSRRFVTFIDDHTRTWVFLMKEKSEVGQIFEYFHNMVKTQFQASIQVVRTDNGREYYNSVLGSPISRKMELFIRAHAPTPHNKMGLRNGRTVIYWKLLDLCCWPLMSHRSFGEMQSSQPPTSSTECLQKS